MYLKILAHPILVNLNFHMPIIVDMHHPLTLIQGENGSGKSTLLHTIHLALKGEKADGFVYKLDKQEVDTKNVFLFDAEAHNPRTHLELFQDQPEMLEFLQMASHGQVMLSMFNQTFPHFPNGTILLLDEPEMALSPSNQRRVLKMMMELVDQRNFRIIAATHSEIFAAAKETYVINLDNHTNKNVITSDMGVQGASTIQ
ncbi:MAG: AAA family ATPase [Bryobacterales bacterium]|nr:AAA family ATPase [Bryobacterales bacterium]